MFVKTPSREKKKTTRQSSRLDECDESGVLFARFCLQEALFPPVLVLLMGSATLAQYSMPYCIPRKVILREGDKKRKS